jgi:non-ribosomal peptide synthetase component F
MPSGSKELYIAILGILAAGAAYVPVDADDPDERAQLVFAEAAVRGVITGTGTYAPASGEAVLNKRDCSTARRRTPRHRRSWRCRRRTSMTTPGSSSRPARRGAQGRCGHHRAAAAFVDAEARLFVPHAPLGPDDRARRAVGRLRRLVRGDVAAWRHGAGLVPAPRSLVRSGEDLAPWLLRQGITVVSTVPTLAAMWPAESIENVRLLIFGGEACPPELAARLVAEGREVWNTYGPTEATVGVRGPLDGSAPVRIGLPLDGWTLAVVDGDGQLVGEGGVGELIIGGVGLARYLDPAKDAEKYAPSRHSAGTAPIVPATSSVSSPMASSSRAAPTIR